MEVFITDILHAGFVLLLHSAATVELEKCARLHRLLNRKCIFFYQKWVQVVCTMLWIPSRKSWAALCCSLLIVFALWTWNPERSNFLSLRVKMSALWANWVDWEKVWPPLNSLGELVCMHQWLTGSWAPDNHPLLQELLLHCWQWLDCIAAETHILYTWVRACCLLNAGL